MNIVADKEKFDKIDTEFKAAKDKDGFSMYDIARRYWSDPEYAETLRRQIAEKKRGR